MDWWNGTSRTCLLGGREAWIPRLPLQLSSCGCLRCGQRCPGNDCSATGALAGRFLCVHSHVTRSLTVYTRNDAPADGGKGELPTQAPFPTRRLATPHGGRRQAPHGRRRSSPAARGSCTSGAAHLATISRHRRHRGAAFAGGPPPLPMRLTGILRPRPGALIANNRPAVMRRLSSYKSGPKIEPARPHLPLVQARRSNLVLA